MSQSPPILNAESKRVLIVGLTGAGKTTLARNLSRSSGLPHIEVDKIFWSGKKGGSVNPNFLPDMQNALSAESWVVEGLYRKIADVLPRPDVIYVLDVPWWKLAWRLARRDLIQWSNRERETSDLLWLIRNRAHLPSFQKSELSKRWQTRVEVIRS